MAINCKGTEVKRIIEINLNFFLIYYKSFMENNENKQYNDNWYTLSNFTNFWKFTMSIILLLLIVDIYTHNTIGVIITGLLFAYDIFLFRNVIANWVKGLYKN